MSYNRYDQQEHMRERYEDYMDQKRKEEQQEKYEEDYLANHTTSGVPLYKLVHVTNIPHIYGGFAAVNWNAETNQFLICEPGQSDWAIDRNEDTLRAFAQILAFNPKMWGCHRCGCSAEFKDQERVCGCDACQTDGCCSPAMIEAPDHAPPRAKSQYFMKRRGSLPPPPIVKLERLTAVGSSDTIFEPVSSSPNSASPISKPFILSAMDELRFISH
jgi:hypothetical protein